VEGERYAIVSSNSELAVLPINSRRRDVGDDSEVGLGLLRNKADFSLRSK
jgi:hypothetical protein